MLKQRLITAVFLAAALISILVLSEYYITTSLFSAIISCIAISELFSVTGNKNKKAAYLTCILSGAVIPFLPVPGYNYIVLIVFIFSFILFSYYMRSVSNEKNKGVRVESVVLISLIVVVFYSSLRYLRKLDHGIYLMACSILVGVLTDTGGYVIGKTMGKHKLAKILSPKKTIEGSVGGITATVVIISLLAFVFDIVFNQFDVNYPLLISYLTLASIVAQFGDLSMSSVKRLSGVKDYGKLLPGHGGVLDRFDSLMFVLPFTYIFTHFFDIIL